MGRKLSFLAAFCGVALTVPSSARADSRAGVDAWTQGDFASAVKTWQTAAAQGDADAMFNLGQAYKLGKGVKQDLGQAEALFGRAAAQGHIQASDNYGLLLFQRGQRTQAVPFIRAAADRGDPRSQYLLGIGHFNGDIVEKDWIRAYALVSLAQQAGLPQAATALAQMDRHVPMAQRQQAVELASELSSQAETTRARQLTAADLGSPSASPATIAAAPAIAARGVSPAQASDAAGAASRAIGSPATAGADYARPAPGSVSVWQGLPPRVATADQTPPAAPRPAPAFARSNPGISQPAIIPGGAWRVQLGAFGQPGNADALWNRLKNRPELAGRPRLNVKAGSLTKLQAGGFASAAEARAACDRLSSAWQTCIAVRN